VDKKTGLHYRLCGGFSYAGAPLHLFIVKRGNGDPAQFVPSSLWIHTIRMPFDCLNDIVLRIIE
jgi:hypothetical protein